MKVYNEQKTKVLTDYDLTLGYLKEDKLTYYQEEIEGRAEEGHYKTIKEYENGGKDVEWVVDVEAIEARPAGYVHEDILVYIPYTEQELSRRRIQELIEQKKALLEKYKEDVEQVELFGMERADYQEKKRLCAELIIELRTLEREVPNEQA